MVERYCKEWASTQEVPPLPSNAFLNRFMVMLCTVAFIIMLIVKGLRPKTMKAYLTQAGVAIHKVAKTATEIERKIFHLCGLIVPLIYQINLQNGWTQKECSALCWAVTLSAVTVDFLRAYVPGFRQYVPGLGILRDEEKNRLCGGSYFGLGCTLAVTFFAPVIAMTSIIFLVLGDMIAALIGRSVGQAYSHVKIGPERKKSVEGSVAMFVVCVVFGCVIFSEVRLREYAVVIGALVATVAELYEPFGINDNLTIPVLSSMALTFGFSRTYSCDPSRNPLMWHTKFNA